MDVVVGSVCYRVFVLTAGVVFLLDVEGAEVRWTYHREVQYLISYFFFFVWGVAGVYSLHETRRYFFCMGVSGCQME